MTISIAVHATSEFDSEFDKLYAQSSTQAAGASVPQVLFQLAQRQAAAGNSSFNNMEQLANYLADDFSLHAKLHNEVIQGQCKAEGKNISTYLAALAKQDELDSAVAQKIYIRLGTNYEKVWLQLKPQAFRNARGLVAHFAGVLNVPASKFCDQLVNDPTGSARSLAYSSARASRSQVLRAVLP